MKNVRFGFLPSIGWFLAGALAVVGCTSEGTGGEGDVGSIGVNIDLGGLPPNADETINQVQWAIVGPITDPNPPFPVFDTGVINTSAPGATASFEKFGLPAGALYGVQLTATSVSGDTTCVGQAGPFSIDAGKRTTVAVLLNCNSEEVLGAVRVDGTFNRCAELTMVVASPLVTTVGFDVDVMATANDDEGDTIDFRWTATGGTVDAPTADTTFYTCGSTGPQTITVEVSDDAHQPAPFDGAPAFTLCVDSWTVNVECLQAADCGNGVIDPGEDCDPPDGVTCDSDCQRIPTCGDGIVDPGEDCEPPNTAICDALCQDIDPCSPNPCDDFNDCTVNACSASTDGNNTAVCDYSGSVADGTSCDDFAPNSAVCLSGICTEVPPPIANQVSDICSNNVSPAEISYLPNDLVATALGPVVNGTPVDVAFTGTAFFPAAFLNAAVGFGFTQADVTSLLFTATVRSGATGGPVPLGFDGPLPATVLIPIETDNAACQAGGFPAAPCVLVDLSLPLQSGVATLTPNGGAGGEILVGWDESVDPTTLPLTVSATTPPPSDGIRLDVGLPFPVGLDCTMGQCQAADPTCLGSGTDSGEALPDSALLSIPIAP